MSGSELMTGLFFLALGISNTALKVLCIDPFRELLEKPPVRDKGGEGRR